MNPNDIDNLIMPRQPRGLTVRSMRRRDHGANFSARPLERGTMRARLRASRYFPAGKSADARFVSVRLKQAMPGRSSARAFINLGQQYDEQARNNFAREALLLGLIVLTAVAWPILHALQALAGAS